MTTESILKEIRTNLTTQKKCDEINIYYSSNGQGKDGHWVTYEPSENYKKEDLVMATFKSLSGSPDLQKLGDEEKFLAGECIRLSDELQKIDHEKSALDLNFTVTVEVGTKKRDLSYDDFEAFENDLKNQVPNDKLGESAWWRNWGNIPVEQRRNVFNQYEANYQKDKAIYNKFNDARTKLIKQKVKNEQDILRIRKDMENSVLVTKNLQKYYKESSINLDIITTDNAKIFGHK